MLGGSDKIIKADETYVGGVRKKHQQLHSQFDNKAAVVGIVEKEKRKCAPKLGGAWATPTPKKLNPAPNLPAIPCK